MEQPRQWNDERAYFDDVAMRSGHFALNTIAPRYESAMARPLYPLEVAYSFLGDLRGKRILDVGCGNGENSLLFARWGAHVTGIDISGNAIALSKARAAEYQLTANTTFLAMPFEEVAQTEKPFDVVWSAAFLHHVLDRLDDVVAQLRQNVTADGVVVMLEPVRFSPLLKRIRAAIPPYAEGTPDERPLEADDLAKIWRAFRVTQRRLYGPISRAGERFVGDAFQESYETGSRWQRAVLDSISHADRFMMSLPLMESTAMIMVAALTPTPDGK